MVANGEADVNTFIMTDTSEIITSGTSLKMLGFYFERKPNADEQVKAMIRKFFA